MTDNNNKKQDVEGCRAALLRSLNNFNFDLNNVGINVHPKKHTFVSCHVAAKLHWTAMNDWSICILQENEELLAHLGFLDPKGNISIRS